MKVRENVKVKAKGFFVRSRLWVDSRGFGMNEVLGIAAALIIAGLIVIPQFKNLANSMMGEMAEWWGEIADDIFNAI